MRVAVISDIHGNLVAFEAVLAEIEREAPDRIVCLGDVASTGPQPHQAIARLRMLNCPVVRGNADDWLLDPKPEGAEDEKMRRIDDIGFWVISQLTEDDLAFIRTFQPTVTIPLGGEASLLCFHGTPGSNTEIMTATSSPEEMDRFVSTAPGTVLAGGHTHTQLVRRHRTKLVINPGSIGLPYEYDESGDGVHTPHWAEYAMVWHDNGRLGVELRRVPIDREAVAAAARASGMPHVDWWLSESE